MDELNSMMLGGDAFITKPYNMAILLAKIASLLKRIYEIQKHTDYEWKTILEKSTFLFDVSATMYADAFCIFISRWQ